MDHLPSQGIHVTIKILQWVLKYWVLGAVGTGSSGYWEQWVLGAVGTGSSGYWALKYINLKKIDQLDEQRNVVPSKTSLI